MTDSNHSGRPLIEITSDICERAEMMASQGLTQDQIANNLGMGRTTFYEKKAAYVDFSDAIRKRSRINVLTRV